MGSFGQYRCRLVNERMMLPHILNLVINFGLDSIHLRLWFGSPILLLVEALVISPLVLFGHPLVGLLMLLLLQLRPTLCCSLCGGVLLFLLTLAFLFSLTRLSIGLFLCQCFLLPLLFGGSCLLGRLLYPIGNLLLTSGLGVLLLLCCLRFFTLRFGLQPGLQLGLDLGLAFLGIVVDLWLVIVCCLLLVVIVGISSNLLVRMLFRL
mmetsp:Transcript_33970/g.100106  ORF Transcript_33970/g.100106 Transcript_33970/m.100106 type:complete len:207 (+) Transcript_33970:871-1491(+)